MADAIHLLALSVGHLFRGVPMELVPASGSGPVSCSVVVGPERDEVADFPGLRGVLGVERPGWQLNFDQRDLLVRPMPGDRVTGEGVTYQLREVRSDVLGTRWFCRGFIVEPEVVPVGDGFMLPFYFAGFEAVQ
jgi:hypothetical protein